MRNEDHIAPKISMVDWSFNKINPFSSKFTFYFLWKVVYWNIICISGRTARCHTILLLFRHGNASCLSSSQSKPRAVSRQQRLTLLQCWTDSSTVSKRRKIANWIFTIQFEIKKSWCEMKTNSLRVTGRQIECNLAHRRNVQPTGLFDVDSTLNSW